MQPTKLQFLNDSYQFESTATMLEIQGLEDGKQSVILNQTIFYPQGGGQPYDTGKITSKNGEFEVQQTRFSEGIVHHIGQFTKGNFEADETVNLFINKERRLLHCRLHTAGHLVDVAMVNIGLEFQPTKGYHFADSPYVEYDGNIPAEERPQIIEKLDAELGKLTTENTEVSAKVYLQKEELYDICSFVPDYIPEGKPIRVVNVAHYNCLCGGTHVKNISEIKTVSIKKIKVKGGKTRVSYTIE